MWTYKPEEVSTNPLMTLRMLIGDTNKSRPLLEDEELAYFVDNTASIHFAAAEAAEAIAAQYAGVTSKTVGPLTVDLSGVGDQYNAKAKQLRITARRKGGMGIYAGGLSYGDKADANLDEDLITTAVKIDGMKNPGREAADEFFTNGQ